MAVGLTLVACSSDAPAGFVNIGMKDNFFTRDVTRIEVGRVADIALDPRNPNVWYVASAFGGLWKTANRGVTFEEIFPRSGQVESFNLCCIAVDPKNPDVLWLGTGENASQRTLQLPFQTLPSAASAPASAGPLR